MLVNPQALGNQMIRPQMQGMPVRGNPIAGGVGMQPINGTPPAMPVQPPMQNNPVMGNSPIQGTPPIQGRLPMQGASPIQGTPPMQQFGGQGLMGLNHGGRYG